MLLHTMSLIFTSSGSLGRVGEGYLQELTSMIALKLNKPYAKSWTG